LTAIETQVLTLERDPCNSEALHSIFRGFHTIKGLAGFLELWEIQKFAHEVEAVLDRARNSQLTLSGAAIDAVLQSADFLQRWLAHLETTLRNQPSIAPEWDAALFSRIRTLSSSAAGPQPVAEELSAMAAAVANGASHRETRRRPKARVPSGGAKPWR
jgi:two-component system chemotaxis sensor kinase CheA